MISIYIYDTKSIYLLKRFAFLPGFSSRNFSSGNKFESLATRIMDERYSAIQEGAGAKNRGPEINHPSYFRIESSINHFPLFSPPLCIIPSTKRDRGRAFTPRLEKQSREEFHSWFSRNSAARWIIPTILRVYTFRITWLSGQFVNQRGTNAWLRI